MKKMFIYEPAMCCETGLCGVSVDPELLRVSTVVNTLKTNGVEVVRYNLSSAPAEFVANQVVNTAINKEGMTILPMTIVDGQVMKTGSYPTNEEFTAWLEVAEQCLEEETGENGDGCCCSGDCC